MPDLNPSRIVRKVLDLARTRLSGGLHKLGDVTQPAAVPALETLDQLLGRGLALGPALTRFAHDRVEAGRAAEVLSVGYSLVRHADTEPWGHLLLGIAHRSTASPESAWADFAQLDDLAVAAQSGEDFYAAAFAEDPDRATELLRRSLDAGLIRTWNGTRLLIVARAAFVTGHEDLAREITDLAAAGKTRSITKSRGHYLKLLTTWYSDGERTRPIEQVPSDVRFGVINYKQPDNSSRNVGDWIQTIASLGHLVRHEGLQFTGTDPKLVSFVERLAADVKPERRLQDTPPVTVQLVEWQRDASGYQDLPDPVWSYAFGWYMHPTFDLAYSFPFNPNIRPIFVSFHLNQSRMLDAESIEYLRRYGPIGCRDWQSVATLRAAGVPAFFSGCITTTIDTVFPAVEPDTRSEVGYVDFYSAPHKQPHWEQSQRATRDKPLIENLELAHTWMTAYNTRFSKLHTSRLHCFLPARSVGCEVDFQPRNRADVRFGGLIDTDAAAFNAIRDGILAKLASVTRLILSGTAEDEVYEHWRTLCAPEVERSAQFLDSLDFTSATAEVEPLLAGRPHVALVRVNTASAPYVRGLLGALKEHGPDDLAVVLVGRAAAQLDPAKLGDELGLDVVTFSEQAAEPSPASGSRDDLLLVAALKATAQCGRVLVLPVATLIRADLAPLFDLDLGGSAIAARPNPAWVGIPSSVLVRGLSSRQRGPVQALAFLAAAMRRNPHDLTVPEASIIVVDPAALAATGFGELAPSLVIQHKAGFLEALSISVGSSVADLPRQYNEIPYLETPTADAALVNYSRGAAPWEEGTLPFRGEWKRRQGAVDDH